MTPRTGLAAALRAQAAVLLELAAAAELDAAPPVDDGALVGPADVGLSAREWRAAVRSGALRASRVGRRFVATRADVAAYVEAQRVQPSTRTRTRAPASSVVDRALAAGRLRAVGGR